MKNIGLLFDFRDGTDKAINMLKGEIKDFILTTCGGSLMNTSGDGIGGLIDCSKLPLLKTIPNTDEVIAIVTAYDVDGMYQDDDICFNMYLYDGKFSFAMPGRIDRTSELRYSLKVEGHKDVVKRFKDEFNGVLDAWKGFDYEENIEQRIEKKQTSVCDDCFICRFKAPCGYGISIMDLEAMASKYSDVKFTLEAFHSDEDNDIDVAIGFEAEGNSLSYYVAEEDDWDEDDEDDEDEDEDDNDDDEKSDHKKNEDGSSVEDLVVHPIEFFCFGAGICVAACLFAILIKVCGGM